MVELYSISLLHTALRTQLTTIYLEDFFITSQFLDFLTQRVGGFLNNILRELLLIRINYEVSVLYRTPVSADVRRRQRWTRRPTSFWRYRRLHRLRTRVRLQNAECNSVLHFTLSLSSETLATLITLPNKQRKPFV